MASFKLEQNAYFLEAQRLAEEERKRHLLGIRPPESLISQQPSTSKADVKGRRSSGRITTGGLFETTSVEGLSPGLSILKGTRHVFIQRAGTEFVDRFFDLENRFDLLNTNGERIFFAGETIQAPEQAKDNCCPSGPLISSPYDVSVISCNGGGILSIVSTKSGASQISDFRNPMGTVKESKEFSWCCGLLCKYITTFSVKDKDGNEIYRIGPRKKLDEEVAENPGPREYNIFDPKMTELVGRISRKWGQDVPPHALWSNAYGVCFPENTPIEKKALLLGALITIVGNNNFKDLGGFMQRDY